MENFDLTPSPQGLAKLALPLHESACAHERVVQALLDAYESENMGAVEATLSPYEYWEMVSQYVEYRRSEAENIRRELETLKVFLETRDIEWPLE